MRRILIGCALVLAACHGRATGDDDAVAIDGAADDGAAPDGAAAAPDAADPAPDAPNGVAHLTGGGGSCAGWLYKKNTRTNLT
jgi:hypothetical protein